MTAAELVAHLRVLDVRLSVEGDRLRCSAPKGVLTDELRDQLATRKAELVGWLREHGERDGLEAAAGREPASFAQQRLWFMDQLSPGGFAYNITGGIRIQGALNIEELELDDKMRISGGVFSTTALSQGQRKRLALLTAFLEDRPIYVLDEWAADQDPHYREIFYRHLLPDLKARGKAIVVISHDDRYYHLGDRIVKLEDGKLVQARL